MRVSPKKKVQQRIGKEDERDIPRDGDGLGKTTDEAISIRVDIL